jgi:hypothetical protein
MENKDLEERREKIYYSRAMGGIIGPTNDVIPWKDHTVMQRYIYNICHRHVRLDRDDPHQRLGTNSCS